MPLFLLTLFALVASGFAIAGTTSPIQTYVLDQEAVAPVSCPELTRTLRHAFIDGIDEQLLLPVWDIDCEATTPQGTAFAFQMFLEPQAATQLPVFQQYLAAHQSLSFWSLPFTLKPAHELSQKLVFLSGNLKSESPWRLESLEATTYHDHFPTYGAYRAFYQSLLTAMWDSGPEAFADYLGGLFGTDYGRWYYRWLMPQISLVETQTELIWSLDDGSTLKSRMVYDVLKDCRARENGRCR